MAEVIAKLSVPLTQSYRLIADSDCFVLRRRHTVDPTKAPGFSARLAQDPTLSTEPRETWRDDGYYALSAEGLTAAINSAVIRTVSEEDCGSLAELLRKIKAEIDRVAALVDAAFVPEEAKEPAYGSAEFPYVYHEDSVDGRTVVPEPVARGMRK